MVDMKLGLSRGNFYLYTAKTLQSMFEEDAFTDVTIVCEDNKQIKAHKVILSSCSQFFRDIFHQNPHPHPLVYLRLPHDHLVSLVRFMYLGQCEVDQTDIDCFLENAKHIKVAGLTTERETGVERKKSEVCKDQTEPKYLLNNYSLPVLIEDPLEQELNQDMIKESSVNKDFMKLEAEDHPEKYICPVCNAIFLDIATLKLHIENHDAGNLSICENKEPNITDVHDSTMTMSSNQNDKLQYICNLCEHEDYCEASLTVHKKKKHSEDISESEPKRKFLSQTVDMRKRVFSYFKSYISDQTNMTIEEVLRSHNGKDILTELFFGFFSSFTLKENSANRIKQKEGKKPTSGYLNKMKSSVKNQLSEEYKFHLEHRDPEFINRWKEIEGRKSRLYRWKEM